MVKYYVLNEGEESPVDRLGIYKHHCGFIIIYKSIFCVATNKKKLYFHCTAITHSIGTILYEHNVDRQHVKWNRSTDVLYFRTDNQVTGCYFPATCVQFIAKPNQWLLVISCITLSANRAPALLKYILIFLWCGSFIVEVIIPRWGWQQCCRRSALTSLQFPPHLISTWLHSTRERAKKMKKRGVILRMEMATLKQTQENGPFPSEVSLEMGASKELCAATAKDTNDPMTLGKECWSVNLALDDPSYVGQNE